MKGMRYEPLDPTLSCYDHGIAELRIDGQLRAHLACVVMRLLNGDPWPWFVMVWPDGHKELPEEDYGPDWLAVQEWDQGFFTYWEFPSTIKHHRFFGTSRTRPGSEITYEMGWLPPDEAARTWRQLDLQDSDF